MPPDRPAARAHLASRSPIVMACASAGPAGRWVRAGGGPPPHQRRRIDRLHALTSPTAARSRWLARPRAQLVLGTGGADLHRHQCPPVSTRGIRSPRQPHPDCDGLRVREPSWCWVRAGRDLHPINAAGSTGCTRSPRQPQPDCDRRCASAGPARGVGCGRADLHAINAVGSRCGMRSPRQPHPDCDGVRVRETSCRVLVGIQEASQAAAQSPGGPARAACRRARGGPGPRGELGLRVVACPAGWSRVRVVALPSGPPGHQWGRSGRRLRSARRVRGDCGGVGVRRPCDGAVGGGRRRRSEAVGGGRERAGQGQGRAGAGEGAVGDVGAGRGVGELLRNSQVEGIHPQGWG